MELILVPSVHSQTCDCVKLLYCFSSLFKLWMKQNFPLVDQSKYIDFNCSKKKKKKKTFEDSHCVHADHVD